MPIADRSFDDAFVELTPPERDVYERVEDYITSPYNNASKDRRTAIGFVMTIYWRLGSDHARRHQGTFPKARCGRPGLHGRGCGGPELPVLRRDRELRHALEPHARRAAHWPHRPRRSAARHDQGGEPAKVVNLHDQDTVETDVYLALRERIDLFQTFVGGLQPILSKLPKAIEGVALSQTDDRKRETDELVEGIRGEVTEAEESGFDLDQITEGSIEEKPRPEAPYGLQDLARILQRTDVMPKGDQVKALGPKDHELLRPGMSKAVRVTTDPDYFEEHADNVELWSQGSPLFPRPEDAGGTARAPSRETFHKTLGS